MIWNPFCEFCIKWILSSARKMMLRTKTIPWLVVLVIFIGGAAHADNSQADLGQSIVAFCEQHKGEQVGNGECSVLAYDALRHVGARTRGKDSPDKGDYTWGNLTLLVQNENGKAKFDNGAPSDLRPGDIIQFRDAKFVHHQGSRTAWMKFGHHTAVVASVEGNAVHIFQQNYNDKKIVTNATLHLDELTAGWLRFYHPVPKISIKRVS
jgi:hypothetical protein